MRFKKKKKKKKWTINVLDNMVKSTKFMWESVELGKVTRSLRAKQSGVSICGVFFVEGFNSDPAFPLELSCAVLFLVLKKNTTCQTDFTIPMTCYSSGVTAFLFFRYSKNRESFALSGVCRFNI